MTGVNFSRSLKASAIAAVAMGACVSLSACQESPSAAAEVGGHRISVDDVQVVSRALCAERQSAPAGATGGPAALSQVEDQALQALVSARLTDQFTHGAAVDETELNQQLSQVQPLIDRLPADQQEKAHDLISQIFVGQIRLTDVGINMAGGAKVQADQAYALGVQARAQALGIHRQTRAQSQRRLLRVVVEQRIGLVQRAPVGQRALHRSGQHNGGEQEHQQPHAQGAREQGLKGA